jgi:pimeloyl-ACP methyl ester carboxylesterase
MIRHKFMNGLTEKRRAGFRRVAFAGTVILSLSFVQAARAQTQRVTAAVASDPAPDKENPASMATVQVPSHGVLLNGLVYVAAGAGPHPLVVLLHGFPGNEKNLDLAQAVRRAGWDVLYFNYRGSWGSPGDFSFTHAMEDAQAAIAFLRDPATAKKLRADSSRIVLIGHSMGGFMASYAAAQDTAIQAIGMISAWDIGREGLAAVKSGNEEAAVKPLAASLAENGLAPLAGCTAESLAREILANRSKWEFVDYAGRLAPRPVLITTSDDGLAPSEEALAEALRKAGDANVKLVHMATDHGYSDHRIALETAVIEWLESSPKM